MSNLKVFAENRKARHDYFILETLECGIELKGTEIKSIRKGSVSLKEAWCDITDERLTVRGMHIAPYEFGNRFNVDPMRVRTLLAHKKEIVKLAKEVSQQGTTLIPLRLYISSKGKIKLELAVCKGKKTYDKRESLKEQDIKRELARSGVS